MSKKRKCRYTPEETAIHAEAVRLRKMTDRQLVEEFHRAAEPEMALREPEIGQKCVDKASPTENTPAVQRLLNALSEGKCKGVKGATVYKISQFATEMGLL